MKERPVIAITGSAGKTTTKEMVSSILSRKWNIYKSSGNSNTTWATQKHKKNITDKHQAVVLEYGMNSKGTIAAHCETIKPTIGIITNVGTAHIGNFGGEIEGIALCKSELIKGMKQTGILILNADDPNSKLLSTSGFKGQIAKVGYQNDADYFAYNIQYNKKGMTFDIKIDGDSHSLFIPIFGHHHVINALLAIAVTHQLGITPYDIKEGLKTFLTMKQRLKFLRPGRGINVIDDTYSANPEAAKAAIDVLQNIGHQKKIVILGNMLELGNYSIQGHQEVGRYIAEKEMDLLFTVGNMSKEVGNGALAAGMPADSVKHFSSKKELHKYLKRILEPKTTILVKGSNKSRMKDTVQFLQKLLKSSK
ncbi:UDP-N-acetylmuramoyl-tripeptide--D-alanyl-D-alanine ligase [Peribacillus deserti]|uniref:UDP-N-acetylmuramoyl-tripeptide--D-alanyl-D-alanine ligase n=1 Tax=Peribacillus deserti TaxID=673318 RepID=A0A2N5M085_9BACI|nr:UDP-N-acetylmuramoyl-tripeptide--D-alanyl-D-alanine ligase [Peribacillus deserti]PLT27787.1 UDP-N-acetylmuramoyl-tripeptide--D-alanyl-D-alanine ligase [Peribacillus deserti]